MPALAATRRLACTLALLAGLPAAVAQSDNQDATPITVGHQQGGSLTEGAHAYTMQLDADMFVVGLADQLSVDVVVKLIGPDGEELASIDGPALGPERFKFQTDAAGEYTLEVHPFEGATGDYTLEISLAEPVATDPEGRVDQMMAAYNTPAMPGGIVAVYQGGELIFARGYGMANLEHNVPWDARTVTNIGSTSKQFTAMAIGILANRGDLSLDDDIRDHIPELPDLGHTVTVRNLLTHTSGYREFLNLLAMGGRQMFVGDYIDRSEIVGIIKRQPELQNIPGDEFNYNNSAFALLTIVVENITGQTFAAWMDENVFTPLGMDDTVARADRRSIISRRAAGYLDSEAGGFVEASDLGGAMGAGGVYTTVSDLARWINNLHTGSLGGEELIEQMTTSFVLNSGEETGYGLGLGVTELGGLEQWHHGGADIAHRSMLMYFPEINAGVVTLSNYGSFDGSIAKQTAQAFFADEMTAEEEEAESVEAASESDGMSIEPEGYGELVGDYEFEEMPGFVLSVTLDGDTLQAQATGQPKLSFETTSGTTFKVAGAEIRVRFLVEDDGTCPSIMLLQNGEHKATRQTEAPWAPSADDLEVYAGRYFSEELEAFYTLVVEDDTLKIEHRRFEVGLKANKEHEFTGGNPVAKVEFVTDDDGNVTGLKASSGRTRNIWFARQD